MTMKKILIGILVGISILGVSCDGKIAETQESKEVVQLKEDDKREEFLEKVETYMQNEVDEVNKKYVEDKITLKREDDVITYTMPLSDSETLTQWNDQYPQGDEFMVNYAKNSRQMSVNTLSNYYDSIVEEIGDDYEFYIRSEKSQGGEVYLITKYGKDGYEFEYDLFEQFGY